MIAHSWPLTAPEGAYVIDGTIYFPEQDEDEEAFSSDLLSRHPDCWALPMQEEYVRLYDAHGEEKAEVYLHKISNELTSDTLSLDASDEEIRSYARKVADQFSRLPRLFKNPANAARVLSDIAHSKYSVTPPWMGKKEAKPMLPSVTVSVTDTVSVTEILTSQNTRPFPVTVTGKNNYPIPVTGKNPLIDPVTVIGILAHLAVMGKKRWTESYRQARYRQTSSCNGNRRIQPLFSCNGNGKI